MKPVEFLKLYFAVNVGGKCLIFTASAPLMSISWLIGVASSNSAEILSLKKYSTDGVNASSLSASTVNVPFAIFVSCVGAIADPVIYTLGYSYKF